MVTTSNVEIEGDVLYEHATLMREEIPDEEWLIPGLLTRSDKLIIFAAPGVGKSILVQQLAVALATESSFLGLDVQPGAQRILFIAGEGDLRELQSRGQRIPGATPDERIWYWPVPLFAMNTIRGFNRMMEFAAELRPTLTILDPIYPLMMGSMSEDEPVGDFVRNMNRLQHFAGCAIILTHHTHRPVKDQEDDENNFFGSMLWEAWAKQTWSMRRDGPTEHYVSLRVVKDRNAINELKRSKESGAKLMLVEPDPLLFVTRTKGLGPTSTVIRETLRDRSMTNEELANVVGRGKSTVAEAVRAMVEAGFLAGNGSWPEKYTST